MIKRQTAIKGIAFVLVFITMLITVPIKRYYNHNISITRTESTKTIRYGKNIIISLCEDKSSTIFDNYKKDIIKNGKLDFYGYDAITGELNNKKCYCVRDTMKNKTMVITYENKQTLKNAILELLNKNILVVTDYQYYRLNRFLFGIKRPLLSYVGTINNIK